MAAGASVAASVTRAALGPLRRSLTARARGLCGRGRLHGTVSGHVDGTTGYITLDHPGKQNAITVEMYRGVPAAVLQASGGRVLVIRGSDQAFSAGSDISEFRRVRTGAAAATAYSLVESAASAALVSAPQPLLACIHGPCFGGGLNLALAADIHALMLEDICACAALSTGVFGVFFVLVGAPAGAQSFGASEEGAIQGEEACMLQRKADERWTAATEREIRR